ncbi:hypothetical protein [Chitinophaga skermanii]|nr:hypothetical protein [Chitinophaga skermanii]
MEVQKSNVIITFKHAENGLEQKGTAPSTVYIAGADQKFLPATIKLQGNKLIATNKAIKEPVAVRFGFSNAAVGNLFGKNGLPVAPFRTDNWDVLTVAPAQ